MLDYIAIFIQSCILGATIKNKMPLLVHIDDKSTDITEENYQTVDSTSNYLQMRIGMVYKDQGGWISVFQGLR